MKHKIIANLLQASQISKYTDGYEVLANNFKDNKIISVNTKLEYCPILSEKNVRTFLLLMLTFYLKINNICSYYSCKKIPTLELCGMEGYYNINKFI